MTDKNVFLVAALHIHVKKKREKFPFLIIRDVRPFSDTLRKKIALKKETKIDRRGSSARDRTDQDYKDSRG